MDEGHRGVSLGLGGPRAARLFGIGVGLRLLPGLESRLARSHRGPAVRVVQPAASAAADFGAREADPDAVDFFHPAGDLAAGRVGLFRNVDPVEVHDGMIAALGENIDEHGKRQRVVEKGILAVDEGEPGNGMALDDRHHLLLDERHHPLEQPRMLELVRIEAFHQFLPGVHDNFTGQRQAAQPVERAGIELKRALILELGEDVVLDLLE